MRRIPILVTGGAGFIGSNFILQWMAREHAPVVNLDKLTYAGNLKTSQTVAADPRYRFVHGDIGDRDLVRTLLEREQPRAIVHFAAESHVDRSIHGPDDFVRTNVNGTFSLLEEARAYWSGAWPEADARISLSACLDRRSLWIARPDDPAFTETTRLRAQQSVLRDPKRLPITWSAPITTPTDLPILTTNCSNNYGPYQFPEKLIPLVILNALSGKPLPVYGDGKNVRDWLLCRRSLRRDSRRAGRADASGETYNIGGRSEKQNLDLVQPSANCSMSCVPNDPAVPHSKLITFVKDRPGHDRRYAMDSRKIERELGWHPRRDV